MDKGDILVSDGDHSIVVEAVPNEQDLREVILSKTKKRYGREVSNITRIIVY